MKKTLKGLLTILLMIVFLFGLTSCISLTKVETKAKTTKKHIHEYSSKYEMDGSYHYQECSCGETKKEEHKFELIIDKEATCKENGSSHYECSICGYKKETQVIDKVDHSFGEWVSNEDETCEADGTMSRTCKWCELTEYTVNEGSMLEHNYSSWTITKEASCTEDGIEERVCSSCARKETRYVKSTGHELEHHEKEDSTCAKDGNTEYYYCTSCKKYFSDSEGKTEITSKDIIITKKDHNYSSWTQTKEATCIEKGVEERACSICKNKETREVDFGSHSVEHVSKVDATCAKDGNIEYYYCTNCKKYFSDSTLKTEITKADTVTTSSSHSFELDTNNLLCCKNCGLYEVNYHDSTDNLTYKKGTKVSPKSSDMVLMWNSNETLDGTNYQIGTLYDYLPNDLYPVYGKVEVVSKDGSKKVYGSLNGYTLTDGDTVNLLSGEFSDELIINVSNIIVNGFNKNIRYSDESRLDSTETIFKNTITITNNVSNITLNGFTINSTIGINIINSVSNIKILNMIFNTSGSSSITDGSSTEASISTLKEINIINNKFNNSNSISADILLSIPVKSINIIGNSFINAGTTLSDNDYCIKINKLSNLSQAVIRDNSFNHLGANYLVDLMNDNETNDGTTTTIDIINNKGVSYQTLQLGNGFRVLHLNTGSTLNFIGNNNLRFSRYYNAVLFSNKTGSGSTTIDSAMSPTINILLNKIYGATDSEITNPGRTTNLTTNYINMGIGTIAASTNVLIDYNYFSSTVRGYSFTTNSSKSSSKNIYGTGAITQEHIDLTTTEINDYYSTFIEFVDKYNSYKEVIKDINENIYAYYTGSSVKDIRKYIPSIEIEDGTRFEIKNSKIVYTGSNEIELIAAKVYNIEKSESQIDYKEIIKDIAYSYYYQGNEIQYDMKNQRRNIYSTPEDATGYRGTYLDCSSYVDSVYYMAFNKDVIKINSTYTRVDTETIDKYAKNNVSTADDVLYYVETKNYTTEAEISALLTKILSELEVGDLVCYRHGSTSGSSGHIMLYVGDNKFLHCTGSSFEANKTDPSQGVDNATSAERTGGSIQLLDAKYVFANTTSSYNTRYLFNTGVSGTKTDSSKKVWSFSIIRPLNNKDLSLTKYGLLRSANDTLDIEKSSTISTMNSVKRGDTITYSIRIKNLGLTELTNIKVEDILSEYVTYIEESLNFDGTVSSNKLSVIIPSVASQATVIVTYKVKVNEDAPIGTTIDSSLSTVNGILTNSIYHTVKNDIDYNVISTYSLNLIGKTNEYTTWIDAVKDIYKEVSIDLTSYMSNDKLVYWLTYNGLDTTYETYPITLKDFYGGLSVGFNDNDCIRLVKSDYLETGDIILTRYSNSSSEKIYETFIYLSDNIILGFDSNMNVVKVYDTESEVDTFLMQLIGYGYYSILRPSLSTSYITK